MTDYNQLERTLWKNGELATAQALSDLLDENQKFRKAAYMAFKQMCQSGDEQFSPAIDAIRDLLFQMPKPPRAP